MKKLLLLLLATAALAGCEKGKTNESSFAEKNEKIENGRITGEMHFVGLMNVCDPHGSDLRTYRPVDCRIFGEEGKMTVRLHDIRFEEEMPALTLSLTHPYSGIHRTIFAEQAGSYIPEEVVGNEKICRPLEQYPLTLCSIQIEDTQCRIYFQCMEKYQIAYLGRLLK